MVLFSYMGWYDISGLGLYGCIAWYG